MGRSATGDNDHHFRRGHRRRSFGIGDSEDVRDGYEPRPADPDSANSFFGFGWRATGMVEGCRHTNAGDVGF